MWTSDDIGRTQLSAGLLCVGCIWGSAWRPTAPSGSLCQKIQSKSRKKLLPGWHKENTWVQIGVSYLLVNSAPDEWIASVSFLGACDPLGLKSVPQLAHGLRVKRNGNPKASWGMVFTQKLCGYGTGKSTNVHCYIQALENNDNVLYMFTNFFVCHSYGVYQPGILGEWFAPQGQRLFSMSLSPTTLSFTVALPIVSKLRGFHIN